MIPFSSRFQPEAFSDFVVRNRRLLAIVCGMFLAIYLAGIFSINLEYFYSRFVADPVVYYTKADHFLQDFSTDTRMAENLPPVKYISWPGYLRIPLFLVTNDFDIRLRLIQITNVVMLTAIGVIFSYYLSIAFPSARPSLTFIIPFIYLMFCDYWLVNSFYPLGDSLFTLMNFGAILLVRSTDQFYPPTGRLVIKLLSILLLICLSTMIKYTGISLILFAIFYWRSSLNPKRIPLFLLFCIPTITLSAISYSIYSNYLTFSHYADLWVNRVINNHFTDWIINLICISLPGQIIPNFNYFISLKAFSKGPGAHFVFSELPLSDYIALSVGLAISCCIIKGMWGCRRRFASELFFFLPVLLVIVPVTTSTIRYLAPYQVFIWIFFASALTDIFKRMEGNVFFRHSENRLTQVAMIGCCILLLSAIKILGAPQPNYSGMLQPIKMLKDTRYVYHDLKSFLGSLDARKTRLLYTDDGIHGKWGAIVGLTSYAPDANLIDILKKYDTYLVIDAPSRHVNNFSQVETKQLRYIEHFGPFRTEKVYDRRNSYANAVVYRIMPIAR